MKTIWKYELPLTDDVRLTLPEGAQVLCVQTQYGVPNIWVMVDSAAPPVERCFTIIGTGHDAKHITPAHVYIGTFQMHNGGLVLHLFEGLCA